MTILPTGDFMKKLPTATCDLRDILDSLHCMSVHSKYLLYEVSCTYKNTFHKLLHLTTNFISSIVFGKNVSCGWLFTVSP